MHVKDVCNAINLICKKGNKNEIYNVGSGKPTKLKYIIDLAYKYTKSSSKINIINEPTFHSNVQNKNFWMSNYKLRSLGFEQKISIEKTIEELSL